VRELRNVIRQAVLITKDLMIGREVVRALLGKPSAARHVDGATPPGASLREVAAEAAEAAERRAISEALRSSHGNKSRAAELLGMQAQVGTIEPGKVADIVAVPGDPLADISVMEKVDFVMKGGAVYRKP
jgi:transcriptional regulator with GAF, ATPase, and Fis domain